MRWQGSAIGGLREEYSKRLIYLGHAAAVKDDLTPAENLSIACTLAGLPVSSSQVHDALGHFGLSAIDFPVKKLSQGQKRRAALARLPLSGSIPLWLLDEPYAALDAAATRLVEELIDGHVARGGAVVLTTHQDTRVGASQVIDLDA